MSDIMNMRYSDLINIQNMLIMQSKEIKGEPIFKKLDDYQKEMIKRAKENGR